MNIPVFVTLSRIFLALFVIFPLTIVYGPTSLFVGLVFVLAALTDFLDGYLARILNKKSAFGALIDPFADKVLTMSSSVGLIFFYFRHHMVGYGKIILIALYALMIRDLFVSFVRQYAEKNGITIIPSFTAKIKHVWA